MIQRAWSLSSVSGTHSEVGNHKKLMFATLDYMYTGEVPEHLDWEELANLFELSHYFDLQDLFDRVQVKLIAGPDFITPNTYSHREFYIYLKD
jgi:BTB/POZ domain